MPDPQPARTAQARRRASAVTRGHILDVAGELFYAQGIRATGVDTIAAQAAVAPVTLYRQFSSKDELVAAYVESCRERYRTALTAATAPDAGTPRERILSVFEIFDAEIRSGACRGCPFLMVLAEYPDPESRAHASAVAHKRWLRDLFGSLVAELADTVHVADPDALVAHLALLAEGVYGSVQALGPRGPASLGRACAEALLAAACRGDRPGTRSDGG
jgi:AcrR family transcriptional regulator